MMYRFERFSTVMTVSEDMERVRGVMRSATWLASKFQVNGSASTTTGVAPARTIAAAQEIMVKVGRITSSPGPRLSAATAKSKAAEPLQTASQTGVQLVAPRPPQVAAQRVPQRRIHPLSMHSARYFFSLPFSNGSLTRMKLELTSAV